MALADNEEARFHPDNRPKLFDSIAPKMSFTLGESYLIFAVRELESSSRELSNYIRYRPNDERAKELLEVQRLLHERMVMLCKDRDIPL